MAFVPHKEKITKPKTENTASFFNEEEAIKNVIIYETDAFSNQDMKAWADSFIQDANTMVLQAFTDGKQSVLGFENMKAGMEAYFKENPGYKFNVTTRKDWRIAVDGTTARAYFLQEANDDNGTYVSDEFRVLEKVDGQWKIAVVVSIFKTE